MTVTCGHCGALHWAAEAAGGTKRNPVFELCCKKGDIQLDLLPAPPDLIRRLFEGETPREKAFRRHLRQYNAALTFVSIKYTPDTRLARNTGPDCFQIHGELYHLQGPLDVTEHETPQYAQLFFYDPDFAVEARANRNTDLDPTLLRQLTDMLHEVNPYIPLYQTAKERLAALRPS